MVEPDLKVIRHFVKHRDNESFNYLSERFGKIYSIILNRYIYIKDFFLQDLLEEKDTFLFNSLLAYNPRKGAKFSTFFTLRSVWLCKKINATRKIGDNIENYKEKLIINNREVDFMTLDNFQDFLKQEKDKRILPIFKKRYKSGKNSWASIAKDMSLATETVRSIHNNFIKKYNNINNNE